MTLDLSYDYVGRTDKEGLRQKKTDATPPPPVKQQTANSKNRTNKAKKERKRKDIQESRNDSNKRKSQLFEEGLDTIFEPSLINLE